MLWASIQDGWRQGDFDASRGSEKYERAIAEFNSREFESLLHAVRLAGWH